MTALAIGASFLLLLIAGLLVVAIVASLSGEPWPKGWL